MVCTPFSSVTTSSLYLLPVSAAGVSPEVDSVVFDPPSEAVVPNSAEKSFKQDISETHTGTTEYRLSKDIYLPSRSLT